MGRSPHGCGPAGVREPSNLLYRPHIRAIANLVLRRQPSLGSGSIPPRTGSRSSNQTASNSWSGSFDRASLI
jgi:hypothetical protein